MFSVFASWTARLAGDASSFILSLGIIALWLLSGPLFHFSDTWQLIINTGTTIVTFLMVFLIQNTQNREMTAIHIKLDEIIRVIQGDETLFEIEEKTQHEIDRKKAKYIALLLLHRDTE